jgi:hypothetical protein
MRWKTNPRDPYKPHRWFAWYPVRVSGDCLSPSEWVWLDTLVRTRHAGNGGDSYTYELEKVQ